MDVDAALQTQIRNIETTYGKPLDHWFAVIDASGLTKHNQVVAMLKADHGLAHGAAHRVSLLARQRHDAGAESLSRRLVELQGEITRRYLMITLESNFR